MEVPRGHDRKPLVALYELIGTALFVYMIVVSTGDALAVPLALFAMIVIFGGITGGHFNPAVTLGVYIHEGRFKENGLFALLIVVSQLIGSLVGMAFASYSLSANISNEWQVTSHRVPVLAPLDPKSEGDYDMSTDSDGFSEDWQTLFTQITCTFIFVATILMLKGQLTSPSKDGALQALTVAFTLGGLLQVAAHHAASFNPAVSLSLTIFQVMSLENDGGHLTHYFYAYFIGPLLGGLLAGVFSRLNTDILTKHKAQMDGLPAQADEDRAPLLGDQGAQPVPAI